MPVANGSLPSLLVEKLIDFGSPIKFVIEFVSSIDRISALSQKIDLTNILNITFEIKKGGQNVGYNFDEINVQTTMRIDTSLPLNQWVNYTIDTSSLTGVHELFLISAQIRDGFCIDSFTYCLEESKADVEINNYVNNPINFNYNPQNPLTIFLFACRM